LLQDGDSDTGRGFRYLVVQPPIQHVLPGAVDLVPIWLIMPLLRGRGLR